MGRINMLYLSKTTKSSLFIRFLNLKFRACLTLARGGVTRHA
jgi:hypothetical protein